ncbi:Uu.00g062290.m01.CDS01 [Anthostomella pinea]|uniref:Uu.00g062290.m01.CDS01 n=1 Tax=Anthostomella pinea TaxID=933095 RepID=A0AAI8VTX6_9PEZI|nr:Uu.00g062290.m01.CDS01 [Anthostomella pinea]
MVTTTTPSHRAADDSQYYFLPGVDGHDEELRNHSWMEPIVIDDDDLMFGGKSLSAWYEEERQPVSYPAEEERRGRQRVRQHHSHSHKHHHHHHHHAKPSDTTSSGEQKKR